MSNETRKIGLVVWGGLAAVILLIFVAFATSLFKASGPPLPVLKELSNFALTNQLGQKMSLDNLRGNVWLADIIFSRCPGPCPRMTKQLGQLQNTFANEPRVRFVTLTADPEFDTVEVLKKYADRFGANHERWSFLTGPKLDLYKLAAADGLLLSIQDTKPDERTSVDDLFIHSTLFVLVDKQGRVRASYETDDPTMREKIQADVKKLLRE